MKPTIGEILSESMSSLGRWFSGVCICPLYTNGIPMKLVCHFSSYFQNQNIR